MNSRTDQRGTRAADGTTAGKTTAAETSTAEPGAEAYLPRRGGLTRLRSAAAECRGCPLYADATQTVFGAGPSTATVMLVGEQPGDQEDRHGEPFVGPAGRVLDAALEELGVDRSRTYVTNVVKHFKFVRGERGKPRLHKKPGRAEIAACLPWLRAELEAVRPRMLVLLGATAAQAVLGGGFRVSAERGAVLDTDRVDWARLGVADGEDAGERLVGSVLATVHPSSIVRVRDDGQRESAYRAFADDLHVAARAVGLVAV